MLNDEKYNGWSNYETWLVNLHLNNQYEIYIVYRWLVSQASDRHDLALEIKNLVYNPSKGLADYCQAKICQNKIYGSIDSSYGVVSYSDFCSLWLKCWRLFRQDMTAEGKLESFLDQVNWQEIADNELLEQEIQSQP